MIIMPIYIYIGEIVMCHVVEYACSGHYDYASSINFFFFFFWVWLRMMWESWERTIKVEVLLLPAVVGVCHSCESRFFMLQRE
jgi:hypothetical protein